MVARTPPRAPSRGAATIEDLASKEGTTEPFKTIRPADPAGIDFCDPILPSGDGRSYAYGYLRVLHELIVLDGLGRVSDLVEKC